MNRQLAITNFSRILELPWWKDYNRILNKEYSFDENKRRKLLTECFFKGKDFDEISKKQDSWINQFWQDITNEELKKRIENFPINKELIEESLSNYLKIEIPSDSSRGLRGCYFLIGKDEIFKFRLRIKYPYEKGLEVGIVHEINHFIYRTAGAGLIYPKKNKDGSLTEEGLTEKLIDNEAKRFVKKNKLFIINNFILKSKIYFY